MIKLLLIETKRRKIEDTTKVHVHVYHLYSANYPAGIGLIIVTQYVNNKSSYSTVIIIQWFRYHTVVVQQ